MIKQTLDETEAWLKTDDCNDVEDVCEVALALITELRFWKQKAKGLRGKLDMSYGDVQDLNNRIERACVDLAEAPALVGLKGVTMTVKRICATALEILHPTHPSRINWQPAGQATTDEEGPKE